jgi:PAS domain S-box-containing protein
MQSTNDDFLRTILDNIPADVVAFDTQHRYQFVNKFAIKDEQLRQWMIGKQDESYFSYKGQTDEKARLRREFFNKTLSSGLPQSFIEKFEKPDGISNFQMRIYNPVIEDDQVKLVVGYGIDVTSLNETEQREQLLLSAIETSPEGIAILNADGIYTYMNDAHSRFFEAPSKNFFIGKEWKSIYHADEVKRLEENVFPELYKNGCWTGITNGVTLTGRKIVQEVNLTLLPDKGLICICKDIMDDLKQKSDLKKLAFIASKTNSMVLLTDPEGKIEWVNDAFERITDYKLKDIFGLWPTFLNGPDTNTKIISEIFQAIKDQKSFEGEMLAYTRNGRKLHLYINLTPVFNEENKLTNFISVENDITEFKLAEAKKRAAIDKQKELANLKADFVSTVSHELRTPLTIMKSSAEILIEITEHNSDDEDHLSQIKKHVKRIDTELDKMASLMNRILMLGKINAGKLDFRPSKTDLIKLLDDIKGLYYDYDKNSFSFQLTVIGKPYTLTLDENLMEQVLRNLISNALKFSEGLTSEKPIVSVHFLEHQVELQVKDFGIGVPANATKRLFDDFFRADNAKKIPGTGLGLSLVKRILDMHKALYSFETSPNKGFTFSMTLFKKNEWKK